MDLTDIKISMRPYMRGFEVVATVPSEPAPVGVMRLLPVLDGYEIVLTQTVREAQGQHVDSKLYYAALERIIAEQKALYSGTKRTVFGEWQCRILEGLGRATCTDAARGDVFTVDLSSYTDEERARLPTPEKDLVTGALYWPCRRWSLDRAATDARSLAGLDQ